MSEYDTGKPNDEDLRQDDQEYNPAVEPKSAKAWINLLQESEDAFENWNARCDNIDKLYASLEKLASADPGSLHGSSRQREFQLFWANCEVIKPAIYAKAPIPVVVPKFKDRRPVYQQASEVMERCCIVAFDLTRINDLMLLVRDDVAIIGRGVATWCRYESWQGIELLRPRKGLHRLQGAPRLPARPGPQLARSAVGGRRQPPNAQRGAQAV